MTFEAAVASIARRQWNSLMRHRERFARAWCASTGVRPENAIMMFQAATAVCECGAPGHAERIWFEPKPGDLPPLAPMPPTAAAATLERVKRIEAAVNVLVRWHSGELRHANGMSLGDELQAIMRGEFYPCVECKARFADWTKALNERDEARAEVERLRKLFGVSP